MDDREDFLLVSLLQTEYWPALKNRIEKYIERIENEEEYSFKICDNPLIEDFRVQMGIKIGMKRVLRIPEETIEKLNRKGEF